MADSLSRRKHILDTYESFQVRWKNFKIFHMTKQEFLGWSLMDPRFESLWLDWEETAFEGNHYSTPWCILKAFPKGIAEDNLQWVPLFEKDLKYRDSSYVPESAEEREIRKKRKQQLLDEYENITKPANEQRAEEREKLATEQEITRKQKAKKALEDF